MAGVFVVEIVQEKGDGGKKRISPEFTLLIYSFLDEQHLCSSVQAKLN